MVNVKVAQSLHVAAIEFKTSVLDNPSKNALSVSEKHWMEELSKVYLSVELKLDIPDEPTTQFKEFIQKLTAFGNNSALVTRIFTYSLTLASEDDFFTNISSYISTIERRHGHWSQKYIESDHFYKNKRLLTDFMNHYFKTPKTIPQEELAYYVCFYFKHFYRLLYEFMLYYNQARTPIFYGRST